jgi:hypothetical protein
MEDNLNILKMENNRNFILGNLRGFYATLFHFWSRQPNKLIVGMQPYFDPTG